LVAILGGESWLRRALREIYATARSNPTTGYRYIPR
jgi:hypothetical protein